MECLVPGNLHCKAEHPSKLQISVQRLKSRQTLPGLQKGHSHMGAPKDSWHPTKTVVRKLQSMNLSQIRVLDMCCQSALQEPCYHALNVQEDNGQLVKPRLQRSLLPTSEWRISGVSSGIFYSSLLSGCSGCVIILQPFQCLSPSWPTTRHI